MCSDAIKSIDYVHCTVLSYTIFFTVEARIEQIYSSIGAIQTQIRSQFKVAMLQQSRSVWSLKVEDFYYNDIGNSNSLDLTVECAKVAVSISNTVKNEVKTVEGPNKKKGGSRKGSKKKSSILAQGPTMSGTRKSSRKRVASSLVSEVPLASSTLTAAALGNFITFLCVLIVSVSNDFYSPICA